MGEDEEDVGLRSGKSQCDQRESASHLPAFTDCWAMHEGGGFFITDDAAGRGIDGEVAIHMQGDVGEVHRFGEATAIGEVGSAGFLALDGEQPVVPVAGALQVHLWQ